MYSPRRGKGKEWLAAAAGPILQVVRIFLLAIAAASFLGFPAPAPAQGNEYPIVLVHGLLGFGREELFGYKYWGGFTDLEGSLRGAGFAAHTAAVGPVASNWDRACELYACLRGGKVDYGEAHAARHGHARFGRTYPGLLPQWGEHGPADAAPGAAPGAASARRVHLVGHSLGGQTGRVLIQLLAEGSAEERAATPADSVSPLFEGGKHWVASLTTIATPHDGTTLVARYDLHGDFLKPLFAAWIALSATSSEVYYDFKLEQWGLERRPGEEYRRYRDRVLGHEIWRHTTDTAYGDGSPEGARELNRWVRARPDVYYFSWSTEATWSDPFDGTQVPQLGMPGVLGSSARFMGAYTRQAGGAGGEGAAEAGSAAEARGASAGPVPIDPSWWPNDGVVNTRSMAGPTLGSSDRIVAFTGTPLPGVWNHMGTLRGFDHLDVIGIPLSKTPRGYRSLADWYVAHARLLASLPPRDAESP